MVSLVCRSWIVAEAYLSLPSKLTQQLALASYGTPIRNTSVSGRITGRKLSVCGAMAVTKITGFEGWQRLPPAARFYIEVSNEQSIIMRNQSWEIVELTYAVDPVGVATQIPSA